MDDTDLEARAHRYRVMQHAAALHRALAAMPPEAARLTTGGDRDTVGQLASRMLWSSTADLNEQERFAESKQVVARAAEIAAEEEGAAAPAVRVAVELFDRPFAGQLASVPVLEAIFETKATEELFAEYDGSQRPYSRIVGGGVEFRVFESDKRSAALDFTVPDLPALRARLDANGGHAIGNRRGGVATMPSGGVVMQARQAGWAPPVESTRTGNVITVRFEDGRTVELPCRAALIGNPIARQISGWAVYRRQEPWRLLDGGEHEADLQEMLAAMPEADRYFDIEPGWYALAAQCWRQLKKIDPTCIVTEVKEKWAELRISACDQDGQPVARFGGPIGWARKQSLRTCEWCAGSIPTDVSRPGRPSRLCGSCREFADAWERAREGRIRISAPSMYELKPQMEKLLSEGWTMARMDKPIAEGPGLEVSAWFERQSRRSGRDDRR